VTSDDDETGGVVIERTAARALLLASDAHILLIRSREPVSGRELWLTPGGGLDPGEDPETCLARELREETGLRDFCIGPRVWVRRHEFDWDGRRLRQREHFFLVRTEPFEPTMEGNPEAGEKSSFLGFRWWSPSEISASHERFVPRRLGEHLQRLIERGPPPRPIDVGV
jgi:8-oxo-dGTP pyrophosphatase MutT (NUDIX family)